MMTGKECENSSSIQKRKERNFKEEDSEIVSKKLKTCLRDSISLLPEDLLGNILSRLPTKLAASTSVLSKKWRTLFSLVHNLDFDDSVSLNPNTVESFKNFVDRTLTLQGGSSIKKFSLNFRNYSNSELDSVCRWIVNVIERGVSEMHICSYEYKLPRELYRSKTLVELTLGRRKYELLPPDLYLPALKILSIDSLLFESRNFCDVFLAGCPVLEELSIFHIDFKGAPRCICSQTIKKLKVFYANEHMSWTAMLDMSFNAPNLVSLDYTDLVKTEYMKVNLKSLVEAKLDLTYSKQIHNPDLTNLILGISNVQTLHLSHFTVNAISKCCWHGLLIPVFNNLVNLSFVSYNKRGWKLLPHLLKQTPNLETLTIQCLDSSKGAVNLRPFQVKVLHVLGYRNTAREMEDLISFVCGTKSLELIEVEITKGVVVDDDLKMLLEVAAPNCKLKLKI